MNYPGETTRLRAAMSKATTARVPSCAMCGATLRNKGWFCSYRCDVAELKQRFDVNKALFLSRMELAELLESATGLEL